MYASEYDDAADKQHTEYAENLEERPCAKWIVRIVNFLSVRRALPPPKRPLPAVKKHTHI